MKLNKKYIVEYCYIDLYDCDVQGYEEFHSKRDAMKFINENKNGCYSLTLTSNKGVLYKIFNGKVVIDK